MHENSFNESVCGRRAFLQNGTLILTGMWTGSRTHADEKTPSAMQFGLVTDLHYADKPAAGKRYYRETLAKLTEAVEQFRKHSLSFVVELGDLIDAADTVAEELGYLQRINEEFSKISPHRHYVLGNHCVATLTKREFLRTVAQQESYYSFDAGDHHFVVLDGCFRSDGKPYGRKNSKWDDANIPETQVEWLRRDLAGTRRPTIVFVHQRLDVANHYGIKNAPAVRSVLEGSGKVVAVFQGHNHVDEHREIGGIHYCTLVAMVEGNGHANNGYSVVTLSGETIRITGFRRQSSYDWMLPPSHS